MRHQIRTMAVAAIAASGISQFPHPAVAAVGLRTAPPAPVAGSPLVSANVTGGVLSFHGMRVRIGSAAAKTQALLKAHPNFVLPVHPLFVADPAMNAIVIFNANGSGTQTPSAVLSGPNTQLNGPDSVVEDWDVPCGPTYSSSSCTHFLFVVNAGNNTVLGYRYPLTQANQAPYFTFTVPGSCSLAGLGFPAGIEHFHPSATFNPGYLVISDEHAATNGAIETYQVPSVPGPGTNCPFAEDANPPDTRLATPSGVSMYGSAANARLFNANATTVTLERFRLFAIFTPRQTWAVGGNVPASTQGTAYDSTLNHGTVWVTTDQGMTSWPDGVWMCTLLNFIHHTCSNAGPTITAGLSSPVFPKVSQALQRLFVPNLGNSTVTSYSEAGPYTAPFATYTNLASPWDVAGLDF